MRKSVAYEQLVARITAELEPGATVHWDDRILGQESGLLRQIDVSIRRADPSFLGIINAKDYRRPATVGRIDELASVMLDVRANYGALVCSAGFAKTIHIYAKKKGISLLSAHDSRSINWSAELAIPILWIELTPYAQLQGTIQLEAGGQVPHDELGFRAMVQGSRSRVDPLSTFKDFWNSGTANMGPGLHKLRSEDPIEAEVIDASRIKTRRPVTDYLTEYTVTADAWLGTFQPAEYRGFADHLNNGVFTASHLPESAVPTERDASWVSVDLDEIAIDPVGTHVLCRQPVRLEVGHLTTLEIRELDPKPPTSAGVSNDPVAEDSSP